MNKQIFDPVDKTLDKNINGTECKEEGKDQESIQSGVTPDL